MPDQDRITIRREDLQAITRIDTKMTSLCGRISSMEAAVREQSATCSGRLEHCQEVFEGKGQNKLLQWAIGILTTVVIIIGGATAINKTSIESAMSMAKQNNEHILELQKGMNDHLEQVMDYVPKGRYSIQDYDEDGNAEQE
jgi:hypothetical protein